MKIGICDDQQEYRNMLKKFCSKFFKDTDIEYEVFEYESGEDFAASECLELDILLLDIEMKELNGLQIKNMLQKQKKNIKILFVSSHQEKVGDAFGRDVYGFLIKPVSYEKFKEKMNFIIEDINDEIRFVIVEKSDGYEKVFVKDILYIRAYGKYCEIHRNGMEEYLFSSKSLHDWQDELGKWGFGLCHRSYLVNYYHIKKIDKDIILQNGIKVPFSRRNRKNIMEEYRNYVWEKGR